MGWETRHNGRRYLYRNRRIDGKPAKEYIAAEDIFGFGLECADRLKRVLKREAKIRKLKRTNDANQRAKIDEVLKAVDAANADLRTLAEGALYAIGFHKHNRGEWRMHRSALKELSRKVEQLKEQIEALPKPLINYQAPAGDAEAVELFKKARSGDEQAGNEVRKLIVSRGWVGWIGNISQAATNKLIYKAAGHDEVWYAAMTEQVKVLLDELLGQNPTILERLLARRVVNGWIATHFLELKLTLNPPDNSRTKEHLDRALSRAESRMRQAIGELARVRRLKVDAVLDRLEVVAKRVEGAVTVPALPVAETGKKERS